MGVLAPSGGHARRDRPGLAAGVPAGPSASGRIPFVPALTIALGVEQQRSGHVAARDHPHGRRGDVEAAPVRKRALRPAITLDWPGSGVVAGGFLANRCRRVPSARWRTLPLTAAQLAWRAREEMTIGTGCHNPSSLVAAASRSRPDPRSCSRRGRAGEPSPAAPQANPRATGTWCRSGAEPDPCHRGQHTSPRGAEPVGPSPYPADGSVLRRAP
jgi:hypothetical protein